MLLIEHLLAVFLGLTICFLVVLGAALFTQLLDFDHTCKGLSTVDNIKLLYKCGKSTTMAGFSKECFCLHRGVFHSVKWVYLEVFIALIFIGLAIGHGFHLVLDGYDLVDLEWISASLS